MLCIAPASSSPGKARLRSLAKNMAALIERAMRMFCLNGEDPAAEPLGGEAAAGQRHYFLKVPLGVGPVMTLWFTPS